MAKTIQWVDTSSHGRQKRYLSAGEMFLARPSCLPEYAHTHTCTHTHTHTHAHTHSVMVLDGGRVIEYDPPAKLLSNQNTVFYSMAKDAGLTA